MPRVLEYSVTLEALVSQGLDCLYYNSGAFGFREKAIVAGWIGGEDLTLREEARAASRVVGRPEKMAKYLVEFWLAHLPGAAWVMPMSHWAYELDFGSGKWMEKGLEKMGLDAGELKRVNTGSAVEFLAGEAEELEGFVGLLLENLAGSDFMIAFPGHPVLCMVHHHGQLWWMTSSKSMAQKLHLVTFD